MISIQIYMYIEIALIEIDRYGSVAKNLAFLQNQ
jgi:hypothetical protein